MSSDVLSDGHETAPRVNSTSIGLKTRQAQDMIYDFLLEIVRKRSPDEVLIEFRRLFIDYASSPINAKAIKSLSEIIFINDEAEFRNTLKRSCYILINNWYSTRHFDTIKELIGLFSDVKLSKKTLSMTISRLRVWLSNFVESKDYQELKLFVSKYDIEHEHWSDRYASYLLVPQYADTSNPIEQRQAARALSQQLKDKFKFDLAMYTARSQSAVHKDQMPKNPTGLGDDVLRLIKMIVAKRGSFSYSNLANIFLNQTKQYNYKEFKTSLQKYLIFSVESRDFGEIFQKKVAEKINSTYEGHNDEVLNKALLLRTCNRVIEYLTTEDHRNPSPLFILLISQGNPITLVIVLLKIILICPSARIHLETCIAHLINYYLNYPEEECKWIINFLEIFNITFAIFADNVQYNLIKMNLKNSNTNKNSDAYRVFSQLKNNMDETLIQGSVEEES